MKAVVWRGVGDIAIENVPDPKIEQPTDAVVRLTASAICGTDLHFVRGTMGPMVPGTVLGHEGVGVVEDVGAGVTNLRKGDRVVIPSTIACGSCSYCRAGFYAKCDVANPNGPLAGTAFYGGPQSTGPFNGMQAEAVRVPFANVGPVKLPDEVTDDQAIALSDIFTTAYFGAEMAGIKPGHIVAVFGCGPVGQFVITSAFMLGAGRVLAVDSVPTRLEMAAAQGAETIDFSREDPVEALRSRTNGIGPDCVVDAVGVDAESPHSAPGTDKQTPGVFQAGKAPSQALAWEIDSIAKAGTLSIIGVYSPTVETFPIGKAMSKNITIRMGDCNHRKYLWDAVAMVKSRKLSPERILTQVGPVTGALEGYREFDQRRPGWIKVELDPRAGSNGRAEFASSNTA